MSEQNKKSGLQQAANTTKKLVEASKAVSEAAAGNWLRLIKIVLPIIIFIFFGVLIFAVLFISWLFVPKDDGKTSFESPDKISSEEFKLGIINAVTTAYSKANEKVIEEIEKNYKTESSAYNSTSMTIVNPLETASVMETEIYKIYSMFSVYKDRMVAIERMKNPDMKMEDEATIYNIEDLKDMMAGKYNLLLSYTVNKSEWTYQPQKWDSVTKTYIDDGDPVSCCTFTYTITVADVDSVCQAIFDLQDLSNSTDPNIPEESRVDEIEVAKAKTKSIAQIFSAYLSEYSGNHGENGEYITTADYTSYVSEYSVTNINFTPNEKVSVPLGSGYHYSGSAQADFGWRIHPIKNTLKFHTGIDIGAPGGTSIYSVANGVVVNTGYNSGYGNYVIVYHGEISGAHYFITYNHMLESASVSVGQTVTSSTVLGKVGSTGLSTGNHLHFEIRVGTKNADETLSFVFKDPAMFVNLN